MSRNVFALLKASNGTKPTTKAKTLASGAGGEKPKKEIGPVTLLTNNTSKSKWSVKGSHLISKTPIDGLTGNWSSTEIRVAAFDLDSTLVETTPGQKFARHAGDWRWFNKFLIHFIVLQDSCRCLCQCR
ncbi:hypothetical protein CAAN2_03S00315 [[Candida] anglica]